MVSALAFWIAAAGIQFIHIVEKRMLCNECAANLHDGSWEVLMSSLFLFLGRIEVCYDLCSESPIAQKLCMIKDLQIFHKLNQFVDALVNLYLVLPRLREPWKTRCFMQSQTVSVAWVHGMVSS